MKLRGKDEATVITELQMAYEKARDHNELYKAQAVEAVQFYHGDQWTEDELRELKSRKQPPLVFNRIKPTINTIRSLQKGNRSDIAYKPFDQSEWDYMVAKILTEVAKFDLHRAKYHTVESMAFFDYVVTGRGALQLYFDEEKQGVGVEYIDYRDIMVDPKSRYDDLRDADYVHVKQYMTKDEVKALYGDVAVVGVSADGSAAYLSTDSDIVELTQTWVRETVRGDDGKYYDQFDCYIWANDILVKYYESPYPSLTRFPVVTMVLYRDDRNVPYGLVHDLKDVQRTLNYSRSKAIYILNSAKYVYREGAFRGSDDELVNALSKPNSVIPLELGKDDIAEITPKGDLGALLNIMQEAKSEIPEIAGLADEILATNDKVMSGKAIALRQQSGIARLTDIFDGLKRFRDEVARALLAIIIDHYDPRRVVRIVADGGELGEEELDQLVRLWDNIKQSKVYDFDVVYGVDPITLSQQEEAYNNLLQIFSIAPGAIPIEALIKASNWTNKDQILEILKETQQKDQMIAALQQQLQQQQAAMEQLQKNAEEQLKALQDELKKREDTILKLMDKIGVSRLLNNNDIGRQDNV